jgi:hypothetical protein
VLACLNHLLYGSTWVRRTLCPDKPLNEPTISPKTGKYTLETLSWNANERRDSAGLCLLLHGMNASRKQWEKYTRQFPKDFPHMDYLAGPVFKAGNCSLEEAAEPFIEVVEDYLRKFPGKPLILIGTSNGSRIASYIERIPMIFSQS